jgi:predicted Zn-dependent protease with MMP-like domain
MTYREFEKLVKKGIDAIPENFLKQLKNVDIVIEDEPTAYQLEKLKTRKKQGSMILGLYEGVPQTNRCCYGQVLPDKITIFKNSIEKIAHSEKEIKKIVKNTVWHEIAHHFGMDERRVRQAEITRKH